MHLTLVQAENLLNTPFDQFEGMPQSSRPANVPPGHDEPRHHDLSDIDFMAGERDFRAFDRAHRHSGRVRVLRVALPLIGLFILSVVTGAYFWSQSSLPQVSIEFTEIRNDRMVMKNPRLTGTDEQDRPYNLTASQAITNPGLPKQVELLEIAAQVPMEEGIFANILAGTGFYDAEAKKLQLGGEVDVKTDDGMTLRMQDADVDIGLGNLRTDNPVAITTEQATISSERLFVEENGKKVVFESRVRMTIYPDKIDQSQGLSNTPTGAVTEPGVQTGSPEPSGQ